MHMRSLEQAPYRYVLRLGAGQLARGRGRKIKGQERAGTRIANLGKTNFVTEAGRTAVGLRPITRKRG
jgi:hypothetical protein